MAGPLVAERPHPLPDAALELVLLGAGRRTGGLLGANEILGEVLHGLHSGVTGGFRRRMATHREPELRRWACTFITALDEGRRAALLDDPDPDVRAAARHTLTPATLTAEELAAAGSDRDRAHLHGIRRIPSDLFDAGLADWARYLAGNPHLHPDAVRRLAFHPDHEVRHRLAHRSDLTPDVAALLAADPEPCVRHRAGAEPAPRHPARTAALNGVDGSEPSDSPWVGREPVDHPGLDWYHACARSPHPLLRRAAATCRELDAPTVRRLAADEDREVRLLLALHHPDAPPALLLEAHLARPRHRRRLRLRAAFPTRGLPAALAAHEDSEIRELAAADPEFDGDLAALRADPAPDVRRAAAANPRTPATTVHALLADPDADSDLREGAAASPHLTGNQLHALLDRLGVPR